MSRCVDQVGGSHAFSLHPDQVRELERLRHQASVAWPEEARRLEHLGLRDGIHVLDAGCGAGFVTEQLAERNPHGTTVGLEPDPALARIAGARLNQRSGLSVEVGSLACNELPKDYFDFAYARFVFQHVATPLDDLRNLCRLVKPGGRLVVADADDALTVFDPESRELRELMRILEAKQEAAGGDRRIGRKLAGLLKAAGCTEVGFDVIPFTSHLLGRAPFLQLAVTSRLIRLDVSTRRQTDRLVDRVNEQFARGDWHGFACVVAAYGFRPDD